MDNAYPLNRVLPYVAKGQVELDGHMVNVGRFNMFARKGTVCVGCGLVASFFRKERTKEGYYFLNLYGIDGKTNRFILFTRDHIIPECRGGTRDLTNLQPMCADCNTKKGDYITYHDRIKQTFVVFHKWIKRITSITRGSLYILKAVWRK